jgi:cell division septation protein DedD
MKRRLVVVWGVILAGALVALSVLLPRVWAAPASQFPFNSVTVISDPPPPDEAGQFSEAAYLSASVLDPDPLWRSPTFNDSGWQGSYPAATLPGWGTALGGGSQADFIWGGSPGAAVGGRYAILTSPAPQFLFLRKNFCIPINASVSSIQVAAPLLLQVAANPGNASVYYNSADIALNLAGREDGSYYTLSPAPALVNAVRRLGRNTLAFGLQDNVGDDRAAVAYSVQFGYSIDPGAITLSSNLPSGSAAAGTPVVFDQSNTGLSGDGPYTFLWDFGDGTSSTDPAPTKVYVAGGTYNVTLTISDRYGCPSAPVSIPYVVLEPTPTSTPTNTPVPPRATSAPPGPAQPTAVPTVTPTPVVVLLPETGDHQGHAPPIWVLVLAGSIALVAGYMLLRRR